MECSFRMRGGERKNKMFRYYTMYLYLSVFFGTFLFLFSLLYLFVVSLSCPVPTHFFFLYRISTK